MQLLNNCGNTTCSICTLVLRMWTKMNEQTDCVYETVACAIMSCIQYIQLYFTKTVA